MVEGNPVASSLSSSSTGGDSSLGAVADSMGALTNITKGISGVIEGIFQVMSKLFNAIMDASPLLQGMLKIIDKMFKLVLMPIGNMIGRLLMPYVIRMAKQTANFLSKYGNAGPEKMGDILTEGLTMTLQSMIDMIGVVLTKVLWPILTALGQSIVNSLTYILTAGKFGKWGGMEGETSLEDMVDELFGADFQSMFGDATIGFADSINQFGLTVMTGNRIAGNSFAELVTAFYSGSADIANGFQSVHNVLVIGSTKAIDEFAKEFNLANAGLVKIIDTTKTAFIDLVPEIQKLIDTLKPPEEAPPEKTPGETKDKGMNLGRLAAVALTSGFLGPLSGLLATNPDVQSWMKRGHPIEPTAAKGGIVTRPTRVLVGEAGAEAIIPLDRAGGMAGGQTINLHFHGDVYGMDDFERKVEKTVNKYSGRVRGAY